MLLGGGGAAVCWVWFEMLFKLSDSPKILSVLKIYCHPLKKSRLNIVTFTFLEKKTGNTFRLLVTKCLEVVLRWGSDLGLEAWLSRVGPQPKTEEVGLSYSL